MKYRFPKVSILDRRSPGRKNPWCVLYYRNRVAVKKSFPTKGEAEAYRDELIELWKNKINPEDDAEANRLVAGTGYTKAEMIKMGFEHLRHTGSTRVNPAGTISDGIKAYKARQARDSSIRAISLTKSDALLKCLDERFGSRIAVSLTADEVLAFLNTLPNRKGEAGKARTNSKLNYYKLIKGVMRALGIQRPLDDLPKPSPAPEERKVRYFTVEQVLEIFRVAKPEERGAIAMAVFGSFRPYLLQELSADAVDPDHRTVDIPERLAKDDKAHHLETEFASGPTYYAGIPAILWEWLAVYPYQPVKSWDAMVARISSKTGYWIQDGLRHTAATFYFKLHGLDPVVKLLTHEGQHLAFKHYVGECNRAEAERFYALRPCDLNVLIAAAAATPKKQPIQWPADDVLAAMLQEISAVQLAKKLGCSDVAILKRCRARHILKPGVGEWAKRQYGQLHTSVQSSSTATCSADGVLSKTNEAPDLAERASG